MTSATSAAQLVMSGSFWDSLMKFKFSQKDRGRIHNAVKKIGQSPKTPGLKMERLDRTPNNTLWSARVTDGIRIILHKDKRDTVLCYVAPHDEAYRWAQNKFVKLDSGKSLYLVQSPNHDQSDGVASNTGNENIQSVGSKRDPVKHEPDTATYPFREYSDRDLISFGISELFLDDIRNVKSEDELLDLFTSRCGVNGEDRVFDNLFAAFNGSRPAIIKTKSKPSQLISSGSSGNGEIYSLAPIEDNHALQSALQNPWNRWLVFLDPEQIGLVEAHYSGSAKVFGSAGTGKTVVALQRAAFLARQKNIAENSILLLTFSKTLAVDLREKLELIIDGSGPTRSKIEVSDFETYALRKFKEETPQGIIKIASSATLRHASKTAVETLNLEPGFSPDFIFNEFVNVVGPWGLQTLNDYQNFERLGSGKQLGKTQRRHLWPAFDFIRSFMKNRGSITRYDLFHTVSEALTKGRLAQVDHIIVDECQDIGPEILKMIRALVRHGPNDILLCGDIGQSLYTRHHSWLKHGIDIRGRSRVLRINYRTSRQIKDLSDKFSETVIFDADGSREDRRAISKFDGPDPVIKLFEDDEAEAQGLAQWIEAQLASGAEPHEICLISRTTDPKRYKIARNGAELAGQDIWQLGDSANWHDGLIGFSSTERCKGLEFKGVAVISCNVDTMPFNRDVERATDSNLKDQILKQEKNQLYVAMTRARDSLYISGVNPGSIFLDQLQSQNA